MEATDSYANSEIKPSPLKSRTTLNSGADIITKDKKDRVNIGPTTNSDLRHFSAKLLLFDLL